MTVPQIALATISPTHNEIAVAVGSYGILKQPSDKEPYIYAIQIALADTADIMLVKLPWNASTIPKIKSLNKTMSDSPYNLCGIRFQNLDIRKYSFTDRTGKTKSGYTATADNIIEIIP